ncbi:hypothetical protein BDY21DRAFT_34050 [Lineolata rhizophorae]|uniref:Uncharacterized protein n=1 Tax=Lineolata rhizophorae TaxID=578093 RepID=A0A6A6NZH0_9PEZI|nr:hypothetical protein BDY21DRAFT_34050 [Lineolata rhizophorae]
MLLDGFDEPRGSVLCVLTNKKARKTHRSAGPADRFDHNTSDHGGKSAGHALPGSKAAGNDRNSHRPRWAKALLFPQVRKVALEHLRGKRRNGTRKDTGSGVLPGGFERFTLARHKHMRIVGSKPQTTDGNHTSKHHDLVFMS